MGHDHGSGKTRKTRALTVVLVLTSLFLIAEVVGGLVTGSLGLLADAGHMLTDVGGLAMALAAIRFARAKATPQRTYGYHRVEILAAVVNAVVLIGISLAILYEAWERLRNPPPVASGVMLIIASLGLVINIVGALVLRGGSDESLNMKGAYYEVLSDLVSSLGVIVAAVVISVTGWYYADPIVSAGIGLFIIPRTWALLSEAVSVLLEGTPAHIDLGALRAAMESVQGVAGVHDLHVWTITSGMHALSAHAGIVSGSSHAATLKALRQRVEMDFKITHVTIQMEESPCGDSGGHA